MACGGWPRRAPPFEPKCRAHIHATTTTCGSQASAGESMAGDTGGLHPKPHTKLAIALSNGSTWSACPTEWKYYDPICSDITIKSASTRRHALHQLPTLRMFERCADFAWLAPREARPQRLDRCIQRKPRVGSATCGAHLEVPTSEITHRTIPRTRLAPPNAQRR